MKLIRSIREKYQTKRQEEIQRWAEKILTIEDFAGNLYIAYNGTPLIPIEESWTSKEILQELNKLRLNFMVSKQHELGLS